jgi:hypothetical protein
MRRLVLATAGVSLIAMTSSTFSRPQFDQFALAAIETDSARPDGAGDAPSERPAPANPLWSIAISKLAATRDRPLFSSSRRPPTPAVAAAPAPRMPLEVKPVAPEKPPFTLIGTIIGDKDRIAIFFDAASKTSTGVREGESASGWTLRSLDSHSAIVEGSGRSVTLDLPEPEAQQSAPSSAYGGRKRLKPRENPNGL